LTPSDPDPSETGANARSDAEARARAPHWTTRVWRYAILVAVVFAVIAAGRRLDLATHVDVLRVWIESLGALGPVAYVLVYAVLVAAAVPASPLTVLAGAMFGSAVGVVVASVGSTLGAVLGMLAARYLLRGVLTRRLAANARFQQLNRLFDSQGAIIVAVTRLIPLFPFAALNYAFGLTNVRLSTYAFWSWLCMLPMTVIVVVGADAVVSGMRGDGVPWPLVGTVVVMVAILAVPLRGARRKLRDGGE
jgi:uncharacterized membrane protein YdjX (TVP38/TMEM64 family)